MDAILYWNEVALEANKVSHTNGKGEQTGPPLSAIASSGGMMRFPAWSSGGRGGCAGFCVCGAGA